MVVTRGRRASTLDGDLDLDEEMEGILSSEVDPAGNRVYYKHQGLLHRADKAGAGLFASTTSSLGLEEDEDYQEAHLAHARMDRLSKAPLMHLLSSHFDDGAFEEDDGAMAERLGGHGGIGTPREAPLSRGKQALVPRPSSCLIMSGVDLPGEELDEGNEAGACGGDSAGAAGRGRMLVTGPHAVKQLGIPKGIPKLRLGGGGTAMPPSPRALPPQPTVMNASVFAALGDELAGLDLDVDEENALSSQARGTRATVHAQAPTPHPACSRSPHRSSGARRTASGSRAFRRRRHRFPPARCLD